MAEDELIGYLADIDYVVAGLSQFTARLLDQAPKLRLIARVGVGLDNIPFVETKKRGIKVTYTPDAPTLAVAEFTIGLVLDSLRRFSWIDRDMRQKVWNKYMGDQLRGKTIGIIGVGRIGKNVIKLLQPFGVNILGNDLPEKEDHDFAKQYNLKYVSKDELYAQSDVVSLHLSRSPSVHHLINKEVLVKMKDTAILINTSRGGVVDEQALIEALSDNTITGAVLDVYETEPYQGLLTKLDNVLLTAHVGAGTKESRRLMELGAVEEVVRFHRGEKLENEIDHN